MQSHQRPACKGFTLIELMVVVALVVILIALVAPSFKRQIEFQRVQSVNSEVLTDLQFARSEAAARGRFVRITFAPDDGGVSCYSIFTYTDNGTACNCREANPCTAASTREIKTTRFPTANGVKVISSTANDQPTEFAFEPLTGRLYTIPVDDEYVELSRFIIRTRIDSARELNIIVGQTGRPTVCMPTGSVMRAAVCPP